MLSMPHSSRRLPIVKLLVVVFLLAIALFNVIPNYFTGHWSWTADPKVPHLSQLRQLKTEGLTVPGWKISDHGVIDISGHEWLVQRIDPDTPETQALAQTSVLLLLRPQTWHRDLPQVDWMDINGAQRWTADSLQRIKFVATASTEDLLDNNQQNQVDPANAPSMSSAPVEARFLRGWTTEQTFAVVQWYAWINGGSDSPNAWFWADQISQWRDRHKMPWVAVSILIPMKPLGDINSVQSLAEELGKQVQSALMAHVFTSTPSS